MSPDSACLPMRIASPVPGQCRLCAADRVCSHRAVPDRPHVAVRGPGPWSGQSRRLELSGHRWPHATRCASDRGRWRSAHVAECPSATDCVCPRLPGRSVPAFLSPRSGGQPQLGHVLLKPGAPEQVPPGLGPSTPPSWLMVSSGHGYSWHDGRLHALAATALAPGSTYVGAWRIPLRISGHPSAISGGLGTRPIRPRSGSGRSSWSWGACWPGCGCTRPSSTGVWLDPWPWLPCWA